MMFCLIPPVYCGCLPSARKESILTFFKTEEDKPSRLLIPFDQSRGLLFLLLWIGARSMRGWMLRSSISKQFLRDSIRKAIYGSLSWAKVQTSIKLLNIFTKKRHRHSFYSLI